MSIYHKFDAARARIAIHFDRIALHIPEHHALFNVNRHGAVFQIKSDAFDDSLTMDVEIGGPRARRGNVRTNKGGMKEWIIEIARCAETFADYPASLPIFGPTYVSGEVIDGGTALFTLPRPEARATHRSRKPEEKRATGHTGPTNRAPVTAIPFHETAFPFHEEGWTAAGREFLGNVTAGSVSVLGVDPAKPGAERSTIGYSSRVTESIEFLNSWVVAQGGAARFSVDDGKLTIERKVEIWRPIE